MTYRFWYCFTPAPLADMEWLFVLLPVEEPSLRAFNISKSENVRMSTNTLSLSLEKEELNIFVKTENFFRFPALCVISSMSY